jgi:hypothetical protein
VDVNWGDGSPDSKFTRTSVGSLGDLTHVYAISSMFPVWPVGTYTVTVTVTDRHGDASSGSFQVMITNVPNVTGPAQPQTGIAGQATSIQLGSFTDSGTGDGPWTVDVNWGDGTADSKFTRAATGSLGSLTHTYANPYFYGVTVSVNNQHGEVREANFGVTLSPPPPLPHGNPVAKVASLQESYLAGSVVPEILSPDGDLLTGLGDVNLPADGSPLKIVWG